MPETQGVRNLEDQDVRSHLETYMVSIGVQCWARNPAGVEGTAFPLAPLSAPLDCEVEPLSPGREVLVRLPSI